MKTDAQILDEFYDLVGNYATILHRIKALEVELLLRSKTV